MNLSTPNGLSLFLTGLILWFLGAAVSVLIPAFAPIGAVVILLGQVIAAVGFILLIIALIRGAA
jgi:hypothetical protein